MTNLDEKSFHTLMPAIKQRNAFFDALFYDVNSLTQKEKEFLSPVHHGEGTILIVPPISSGREIRHYEDPQDLLKAEKDSIKAISLAGVGSSVLGTAALARNVANAYEIDVVGIVSGYGAFDLLSEAFGGWFFYGAMDRLKYQMRESMNQFGSFSEKFSYKEQTSKAKDTKKNMAPDIDSLLTILNANPTNLKLLVGHSKGDYIIDYALEIFVEQQKESLHDYYKKLSIVTFGAVIDLPPQFEKQYQFIGGMDWFGGMNSRIGKEYSKVDNAWHHMNTQLPFHVPTEDVLRKQVPLA